MFEKVKIIISYLGMFFSLIFRNCKGKCILMNSPEHGNLGDHAISIAEVQLLKENRIPFVELSGRFCRCLFSIIKFLIRKNDIICITGGGYLGSLWKNEDLFIQKIIQNFPDNKIIIFPQTVFFEYSEEEYKKNFIETYNGHSNLVIFLREEKSFSLMSSILNNTKVRCKLAPDMVFFYKMDVCNKPIVKNDQKILISFRDDIESVLDFAKKDSLLSEICENNFSIEVFSTVLDHAVSFFSRKRELGKIFSKINSGSLVITDRLHGMLLSVVSGTPCIVLDNLSGKVRSVWSSWLQNNLSIKFVNDISEISLDMINRMRFENFDVKKVSEYNEKLRELLEELKF